MKRSLLAGAACALSAITMSPSASAGVYIDIIASNILGSSAAQTVATTTLNATLLALNLTAGQLGAAVYSSGTLNGTTAFAAVSVLPNTTLLTAPIVADVTLALPPISTVQTIVDAKSLSAGGQPVDVASSPTASDNMFTNNVVLNSSAGARDMGSAILSRF